MKTTELVPSLETCKKLKELGYPQDTMLYFIQRDTELWTTPLQKQYFSVSLLGKPEVAAPTSAEIGEWLPTKIALNQAIHSLSVTHEHLWEVRYERFSGYELVGINEHLAGVMAAALIWLIENKHFEFGQ